ncbi:MAG: hypothetical protein ACYTBJ_05590 [Planctomycetota bacterium]|jgi:hypothetical protein
MSEPIRITCSNAYEVPPAERLGALADHNHHVVLQFPSGHLFFDKPSLIRGYAAALPEHSVFDSGGDRHTQWITIKKVIDRHIVLAHLEEIRSAVKAYIDTCKSLLSSLEQQTIGSEWQADEHGMECCFENTQTGQIVEAPLLLSLLSVDTVDPYFLELFVKSTGAFAAVAELMTDEFHDSARILDILRTQERG